MVLTEAARSGGGALETWLATNMLIKSGLTLHKTDFEAHGGLCHDCRYTRL
jgi:hypothetical protein